MFLPEINAFTLVISSRILRGIIKQRAKQTQQTACVHLVQMPTPFGLKMLRGDSVFSNGDNLPRLLSPKVTPPKCFCVQDCYLDFPLSCCFFFLEQLRGNLFVIKNSQIVCFCISFPRLQPNDVLIMLGLLVHGTFCVCVCVCVYFF